MKQHLIHLRDKYKTYLNSLIYQLQVNEPSEKEVLKIQKEMEMYAEIIEDLNKII